MDFLCKFVPIMIYKAILKIRNRAYDKGRRKSFEADVPTICIGNVTVGGTGKTPHTEMVLRTLLQSDDWAYANLAVLSRGYKRKGRGFQQVPVGGSAKDFGDEPVQIAGKFPIATVAVDKDRVEGCRILAHPENTDTPAAQVIILDDAFQYRRLRATYNIVLVDYNRPVHKDKLLPYGRLRDLPSRLGDADMIIVSKCPPYLDDEERVEWARNLGVDGYEPETCRGTSKKGKEQVLIFTGISYSQMVPVFPESADNRFTYANRLVLFTGIANDAPLRRYLSDKHKIVKRLEFPDHHQYSSSDLSKILKAMKAFPTACVATTEKDAGRILDLKKIPEDLKQRLFQVPIEVAFLSELEQAVFTAALLGALRKWVRE